MKSRKRRQRGGRLLAFGGQGCVYAPPLRCMNDVTPEGDVVSKLTTSAYAKAEVLEKELISQVDPNQRYSVYAFAGCEPAAQTAEEALENPLNECMVHTRYPIEHGRYLLFYENAGTDLFEFRVPPEKSMLFFEGLSNIIHGLALFHTNNLVHMDVKPENMVAKWLPDTQSYLIRHIDFGFAFQTTKLPLTNTGKFWNRNYLFWSYEVRFLYPDFREEMITEESVLQFMQQSLVPTQHTFPIAIFHKCNTDFYKKVWRVYASMSYEERVDHVAKATDVFSLGKSLSMTFYKWETEVAVIEALRNPFYSDFVAALMEPDPFRRVEIYEVGAMWNRVLQNIRTFYVMRGGKPRKTRRRRGWQHQKI